MSALVESSVNDRLARNATNSSMDRVRLRMTRLIGLGRDRPASPAGTAAVVASKYAAITGNAPAAALPSALAVDVKTLERVIEDSENILRQAWNVAADLNVVRRQCSPEVARVLSEALGLHQGLLNRVRHNLREATQALHNLRVSLPAA